MHVKRYAVLNEFNKLAVRFFLNNFVALLLCITFFMARGPAMKGDALYNPDEAEFLALGKLASQSLTPYENYYTSTSGPVTTEILGFFSSLGFNLDLNFAHLYSSVVILAIILILVNLSGKKNAKLAIFVLFLPITVLWGSGDRRSFSTDLLSLSSEITPLLFLSVSLVFLYRSNFATSYLIFISGSIAGIAFLTKYQVAFLLLIFPILIFSQKFEFVEQSYRTVLRNLSIWVFGWVSSFVTIVALVLLTGNRDSFIYSLSFVIDYGSGDVPGFSQSSILQRLALYLETSLTSPLLVLSMLVLFLFIGMSLRSKRKGSPLPLVIGFVMLFGYLSASLAGNSFGHYIQLWLWSIALSASLVLRHTTLPKESVVQVRPYLFFLLVPITAISISTSSLNWDWGPSQTSAINEATYQSKLIEICPRDTQVLVWGWAAELYARNNWMPPPFFVNNAAVLLREENTTESFNAKATQAAFIDTATKCVIEAIGPDYFGSIDAETGKIENVSGYLAKVLMEEYKLVETSDFNGRVFVRLN